MPDPKLDWFTHDRLGLFVHWGLYALGARHEWLMNRIEAPEWTVLHARSRDEPSKAAKNKPRLVAV